MKSTIKKKIITIFKIIIILVFLYSLIYLVRSGKQIINVKTVSNYYSGSNLNALVEVLDKKTEKNLKSNITVELYDNNGKKVKNVKEQYKLDEQEQADISLDLPEELESGKYILKVIAKTGMLKDVLELPVNITKSKSSETVISLDKGIYKPGDEINYRALVISKNDDTPISSNEISVNIFDGNDNKVYSESSTTSEFGIVSGSFKLSDTVNSGTYRLVVSTSSQEFTKEFTVNPYVTPKFEVNITTDKDTYIIGENANITISAQYFFGEPVTNASVKGTINGEEFVGLTNEAGILTKEIEVAEAGSYIVSLSVEDSSNYFVEASKSFTGATDIFEVEILPEYDEIVEGIDNDVYIITKTAANEAVKTYMTVKFGTISREVITDENGVGKITLSSSDIKSNLTATQISITAENMSGEKVRKVKNVDVVTSTGTVLKTDKVKYNENENITVSLASMTDNQTTKNLYIYKANELVKTVSFEGDSVEFNLEGIYGLVDIYTDSNVLSNYNYYSYINSTTKYNQKTIFIKPSKELSISIETDNDTYAPKDTLNIQFEVENENGEITDSALLVSILDDAILSLADNDLSIDNLKLALNDITLSDGITAADIYAMILDDSNETALSSILLKQDNSNQTITKHSTSITSYNKTYKYIIATAITATIIVISVLVKIMKKNEIARTVISTAGITLTNISVISLMILFVFGSTIYNIFSYLDLGEWITIAVALVVAIVVYTLILYKQRNYIFNLIIKIIVVPGILFAIVAFITKEFYLDLLPIIVILVIVLLLCVLTVISRRRKLNKFWNFIKEFVTLLGKALMFWFATLLVCNILDSAIGFFIVLVVYIFFEKYILKKTDTKIQDGKIILNITGNEVIGAATGVIFIIMIILFLKSTVTNFATSTIEEPWNDVIMSDSLSSSSNDLIMSFDGVETSTSKGYDFSSTIDNSTSSVQSFDISNIFESDEETIEIVEEQEITSKTEENVRNVFLESLAFIPELITNEGKADLSLTISDNITTWNIQTVGNSKDGRIGFASESFKVFKEFFVDFSLPTNTVETDNIKIPLTVYNYTENDLEVTLKVAENDWAEIGDYASVVNVPASSTQLVYVPLKILKAGNNTLRVESNAVGISDIVEKQITVSINGIKEEEVISSGAIEKSLEQDILFRETAIDGTQKIKVKLYPSTMAQIIENMDAILKMPTGCFEQTSSSLYPDILVLKYLRENDLSNSEIEEKALEYISSGYQKLLTYEVTGTKGGYSLYGRNPAEPVITAFGLMEMKDLSEVYDSIDENIIKNMTEYLFGEQNVDGSFDYNSTYIGGASSTNDLAMNAYIIWALSEVCPDDSRLTKSINYLEKNLDDVEDNYTLALIGNAFSNVENSNVKDVIKRLMKNVNSADNATSYISSQIKNYLGSYGSNQNIQTTALTSILLTKEKSNEKTNENLINFIIECKDTKGTWYSTQSTILALKAINEYNDNSNTKSQTITVSLNGESKEIDLGDNVLDLYELEFTNIDTENKISISMKEGKIYYEIVKEYYETYEQAEAESLTDSSSKIGVEQTITQEVNVNDIVTQNISLVNLANDDILNAIIRINIPQGCTVVEDSLLQLEYNNIITKFEYNYNTVDLYIRNFNKNKTVNLTVNYRAGYPEQVTGASITAYDYYNPQINGFCMPVEINVNN